MVFDLIDNKISHNFGITMVFIQSLENLMVSIKKSKKPFKNTKIRPREKMPRVEVGSPNPRRSTCAGSSWVVRTGRPTRAGLPTLSFCRPAFFARVGKETRGLDPASASVVQPSSPARVRGPAVVYPGSTRVDMPLVNR